MRKKLSQMRIIYEEKMAHQIPLLDLGPLSPQQELVEIKGKAPHYPKEEKKTSLQQMNVSKLAKQSEMHRWNDFVARSTQTIELQRENLSLTSKLLIVRRKQEMRHREMVASAEENKRWREASPNYRVNEKARKIKIAPEEVDRYLTAVYRGEVKKVKHYLKKNKDLVYALGNLKDLSDREFYQISGFQYAVWALDREMWNLILDYLPENDAYDQLLAYEKERPDLTNVHGVRFNFQALLDAFNQFQANYDRWNKNQRKEWWCKNIGGEQRKMPAWYVYFFCEEGDRSAWLMKAYYRTSIREAEFLSWWFTGVQHGGLLGSTWAMCRSSMSAHSTDKGNKKIGPAPRQEVSITSECVNAYMNSMTRLVNRLSTAASKEINEDSQHNLIRK